MTAAALAIAACATGLGALLFLGSMIALAFKVRRVVRTATRPKISTPVDARRAIGEAIITVPRGPVRDAIIRDFLVGFGADVLRAEVEKAIREEIGQQQRVVLSVSHVTPDPLRQEKPAEVYTVDAAGNASRET